MNRATLLSVASIIVHAFAACDRAALEQLTSTYVRAQTSGKPDLLPLATNASYIENDAPVAITKGVLSQAIVVDFSRSIHDTVQCATYTEITAATDKHPYVISTKLVLANDKVTNVLSVISDAGDWLFNATVWLDWTKKEKWDAIPESKHDKREVIQAAGDAYLDSWADGKVPVPYGTPCQRLEGGIYTGSRNQTSNSCVMPEFPKPFKGALNRRYVIDQQYGAVAIFNDFPFIDVDKPDGTASTNFVRVEGGKIRYIHENTVCTRKNCGR
ncbi:hypothetical protein BU24DRAFT_446456 [Aaosphaeria arxii CBS 175.79]|uniref:DUF8021 domain-containing protein n=1 Tax=Aaosphaeria arxii CBS 175.79 TaxID=1450172 RepID=A0A6A5Y864_9PLEO|nr:uncharacterized protein BU24DRAFT_446456 [Aaosphaeria arxii CBS 175.79]KAF2021443.1 hypothetical protein BU24DRAFT_446456 [Aaosphaeria arxii CBS 175.79]